MSHNVVAPFEINGPSNNPYNGTVCLPQVPLPANVSLAVGTNITIQVIETAKHGAAIYNVRCRPLCHERNDADNIKPQCADVTLADPKDVPEVNSSNCFNSSDISFELVFSSASLTSDALSTFALPSALVVFTTAFAAFLTFGI